MIGYLRGRIRTLEAERLLLLVGGVGYTVRIPLSTRVELDKLGPGTEVGLVIHTQVRADAIELFGFLTETERTLFEHCLGVSKVGPRIAQAVLSGGSPTELLQAIGSGNAAALTRIPGIGRKTAERMILELRDKATTLLAESGAVTTSDVAETRPDAEHEEAVSALVNLGYRPNEARRSVAGVLDKEPDLEFQELFRRSLQKLSRFR